MRQMRRIVDYARDSTFIKFGLVGASGVVVNNALLWLLTQNGMSDIPAAIIATECAIITNFIGNSLWTWGGHEKEGWQKRFLQFQFISIFAGALTVLLFWIFHNFLNMPLLVANTAAIIITFLVNYTMNKKITWAKTGERTAATPKPAAKEARKVLIPVLLISLLLFSAAAAHAMHKPDHEGGPGSDTTDIGGLALPDAPSLTDESSGDGDSYAGDGSDLVPGLIPDLSTDTNSGASDSSGPSDTSGTSAQEPATADTSAAQPATTRTVVGATALIQSTANTSTNTTSPSNMTGNATNATAPATNTTVSGTTNATSPNTTTSPTNNTTNATNTSNSTNITSPVVLPQNNSAPNGTNVTVNATTNTTANTTKNTTAETAQNTTPNTTNTTAGAFNKTVRITGAYGTMREIDTAEVIAPYANGTVTWTVDGVNQGTMPAGSPFYWTPGMLYVASNNDVRTATITATSGDQNTVFTVRVDPVFNPFWDGGNAPGPVGTATVMTANAVRNWTAVSVVLDNGGGTLPLTKGWSQGAETTWTMTSSSLNPGNTLITAIIVSDGGASQTFTVSGSLAHYAPGGGSGGGGGGGGGGGAASTVKTPNYATLAKRELEKQAAEDKANPPAFVYAVFSDDVINLTESINLSVDAKDNEAVTGVTAIIVGEDGSKRTVPLRLTSGEKGYGTWTATIEGGFGEGKQTLTEVEIEDDKNNSVTAAVSGISFYVTGSAVRSTEQLLLVYAILGNSTIDAGTSVSVRLDARDFLGVTSATALLKSGDEEIRVPLSRISGNPQYGTWEGNVTLNKTDTTYSLSSVTLENKNQTREVRVYGQKVYVKYVKPTTDLAGPEPKGQIKNLRQIVRNPITPLVIGLVGMAIAMIIISSMTVMRAK